MPITMKRTLSGEDDAFMAFQFGQTGCTIPTVNGNAKDADMVLATTPRLLIKDMRDKLTRVDAATDNAVVYDVYGNVYYTI